MATNFDSTAFRASPFMRALLDVDALPATEKKAAAVAERRQDRDLLWRCSREYEIFFHRAMALHTEMLLDRHDTYNWRCGDPRTAEMEQRHDEAVNDLHAILNRWARLPLRTKYWRGELLKAIKESGQAINGPKQWERWSPAQDRWRAACSVQEGR